MPLLCPHCQNPVESVDLKTGSVVCPACGSGFQLEEGATTDWNPSESQHKLGKFELLDRVGMGAFGTVYKARDPELDRLVAIKVPRAGPLASAGDLDRFLREARSVAQLRHPLIVPVYEVGQADGLPYLVSEFVQGVTLTDALSARRLSLEEKGKTVIAQTPVRFDLDKLGAQFQAVSKATSRQRLQAIGKALREFQMRYGRLPAPAIGDPAGKPLLSWRVQLLPFLGEEKLYHQFHQDEAWDSAHNKELLKKNPPVFGILDSKGSSATYYQVFTGPGTAFDPTRPRPVAESGPRILVVEAGAVGKAVPWTRPEELTYTPGQPVVPLRGLYKDGFYALFDDGEVRFIKNEVSERILRALISPDGQERVDLKQLP